MPPMSIYVVPVYDAIQETGNNPDDADFMYLSSLRTMRVLSGLGGGLEMNSNSLESSHSSDSSESSISDVE